MKLLLTVSCAMLIVALAGLIIFDDWRVALNNAVGVCVGITFGVLLAEWVMHNPKR